MACEALAGASRHVRSGCRAGILISALALAAFPGCEPAPESLPPTRGYLLISVDTLRADRLGCYGYERSTSPFLDSLAEKGVLFENTIAQYPNTLASHMSMLTGLYPAEHGVYPPDALLADSIPTLPEVLRAHGFRTAGFTEGGFARGRFFKRGFDTWSSRASGELGDVETTLARAVHFLDGLEADERFFLFVQTYAVHAPYRAPERYLGMFGAQSPPPDLPPGDEHFRAFNRSGATMPADAVTYYEARYDAAIRYTDDVLSRFFSRLREDGVLDDTTVILTSDHGEEFFEHGKMSHTQVYHESLHVPLLLVHPSVEEGRRVASLVESIDHAPTLYDLVDVPPPDPVSGESLLPLLEGDPRQGREAYAESRWQHTLYRQTERELYQVVSTTVPAGSWIPRHVTFDVSEPELRIEVESFAEPRTVHVEVDGDLHDARTVGTARQTLSVTLPPGEGKRRIRLWTEGCSFAGKEEGACRSFRLGEDVERTELFELESDPAGRRDLSTVRPDLHRRLVRRLHSLSFSPVAPPERQPLDDELRSRLRALGYVE